MHSLPETGDSRLLSWLRACEFAVPPPMIRSATARRAVGDWAGACAAAHVDVDLRLRDLARTHGQEIVARVRADLRQLAPDLLRWHMPRIAPDGLLRSGLTISLARYPAAGHLVVRTPPGWADAGQRISLAWWDGAGSCRHPHPHPHPDRRFRLDLHRHLWDADRSGELGERSGAQHDPPPSRPGTVRTATGTVRPDGCAVDRWAAEAAILLRADGHAGRTVAVRLTTRRRLALELDASGPHGLRITAAPAHGRGADLPVLPDAATWVSPDLRLLRAGMIDPDRLHPLVASALLPGRPPPAPSGVPVGAPRIVECDGARHRIGLVDGILVPLDHDPAELRREQLLVALGGNPMPCLRVIDEAHRRPECLADVRGRLDHGDAAGALAAVEGLLGPDAVLRNGALRDELETAALRRITHGLYRAGLAGSGPIKTDLHWRRRQLTGR